MKQLSFSDFIKAHILLLFMASAGAMDAPTPVPIVQNGPVAQNGTFYTQTGLRPINLAPLVSGGTPPYRFQYITFAQDHPPFGNFDNTMGFTPLTQDGRIEIILMPGDDSGTLSFRAIDRNGQPSNIAEFTVIRGTPKG